MEACDKPTPGWGICPSRGTDQGQRLVKEATPCSQREGRPRVRFIGNVEGRGRDERPRRRRGYGRLHRQRRLENPRGRRDGRGGRVLGAFEAPRKSNRRPGRHACSRTDCDRVRPDTYGGAVLLGVNGVCVKAMVLQGESDPQRRQGAHQRSQTSSSPHRIVIAQRGSGGAQATRRPGANLVFVPLDSSTQGMISAACKYSSWSGVRSRTSSRSPGPHPKGVVRRPGCRLPCAHRTG